MPLQHPSAAPLAEPRTAGTVPTAAPRPAPTNRRHRAPRPARRPHTRIQPRRMKPNLRTLQPFRDSPSAKVLSGSPCSTPTRSSGSRRAESDTRRVADGRRVRAPSGCRGAGRRVFPRERAARIFHSLWKSLDRGMQQRSRRARLGVQGGSGSGGRYQILVVPGTTDKRLRRMRRIDGLLELED
jgi:hypothetical protein